MINILSESMEEIRNISRSDHEKCGFITKDGEFVQMENVSESPRDAFCIDSTAYDGEYVAIVHSHGAHEPKPSDEDIVACYDSGVPWLIIGNHGETQQWLSPKKEDTIDKFGLVGRPFYLGVFDCYSIIKDYYSKLGIGLIENPKFGEFWKDVSDKRDPYIEALPKHGFYKIKDDAAIMPHDVVVMSLKPSRPCGNHSGVYIGSEQMLHHIQDARSRVDHYHERNVYGKLTLGIYRHEQSVELRKMKVEL